MRCDYLTHRSNHKDPTFLAQETPIINPTPYKGPFNFQASTHSNAINNQIDILKKTVPYKIIKSEVYNINQSFKRYNIKSFATVYYCDGYSTFTIFENVVDLLYVPKSIG